MNGKGSKRRPGIIPPTAWDRIFAKPPPICGLCQRPSACCGCMPTDDGPGQKDDKEKGK